MPGKIGSTAPREGGGAIIALTTGLYEFDFASGESRLIVDLDTHNPSVRLNDGKVDRDGRFLVGSMDVTEKEASVMFGGPDLDILYATCMARPPVPDGPQDGPLGGSLFALRDLGVRGIAERRFAG